MHYHPPFDFALEVAPGSPHGGLLGSSSMIGEAVRGLGFTRFEALAMHVQSLPYGRVGHPGDPMAVLREGRGTCSSKHRLLASVAQDCGHYEVMLTVGIYAMSEDNTPGVGAVLGAAGLASIPEAHCYLTIDHQRFDFTGARRGKVSPFSSLSAEVFLSPDALLERKTALHKQALARWAPTHDLSPHEAWAIREACIAVLSGGATQV